MKKYLLIGLLAIMGLGMTSCTIYSRNDPSEQVHMKTIDLNVKANSWIWDKDARMYYCHFDLPELTSDIYNYAEVSINREHKSNNGTLYQVALPETTYLQDEKDPNYFYQQHIDYAYGVEFVEIFLTFSDFIYDKQPESMTFRLQLTY